MNTDPHQTHTIATHTHNHTPKHNHPPSYTKSHELTITKIIILKPDTHHLSLTHTPHPCKHRHTHSHINSLAYKHTHTHTPGMQPQAHTQSHDQKHTPLPPNYILMITHRHGNTHISKHTCIVAPKLQPTTFHKTPIQVWKHRPTNSQL